MSSEVQVVRTVRRWGGSRVVTLPANSCENLEIGEGTPVKINIEKLEE